MATLVRAANPIWHMVDHLGFSLNDQYFAHFLTNVFPYLPQNVFHDVNGVTPWSNPLQFQPSGTLPNNLYFDPLLVYRIEIRQGPLQSDPLIWEINNFVPCCSGSTPNNNLDILNAENQLSNEQFSRVSFTNDLVITTAGTYEVAPGWNLVLNGIGTSTITQLVLTGNDIAPYALKINNAGWTSAFLEQNFNGIGNIFDTGAVAANVTAKSEVANENLSINLVTVLASNPSVNVDAILILQVNLTPGPFISYANAVNLPPLVNPNLSNLSRMKFQIVLPGTGIVDISNLQFVGQNIPLTLPISSAQIPIYHDETPERQIDHLFHFYSNSLIFQPRQNILTGWNFSLNPFQFTPVSQVTHAVQTLYIADQTILHQETPNSLSSGKSNLPANSNLVIESKNGIAANRFALIQYIDPNSILPYWGFIVSLLVNARVETVHGTQIRLKARLIYRDTLPPAISPVEPISAWPLGGDPVFAAGWNAIAPLNDPAPVIETSNLITPPYTSLSYNKFRLPAHTIATQTLGVVLYTMDNMNANVLSFDAVIFDKVSLTPSEFATEASVESFDESHRRCQYYYEKSYLPSVLPGTITEVGEKVYSLPLLLDIPNIGFYFKTVDLSYKTIKRAIPLIVPYSPTTGAASTILVGIFKPSIGYEPLNPVNYADTNWDFTSPSTAGVTFVANSLLQAAATTALNIAAAAPLEGLITFHYTLDARLGI